MIRTPYTLSLLAMTALFAGCASSVPPTIVNQPTSVRPIMQQPQVSANGSIYQAATNRMLFEDKLARHLGDNVTVMIEEQIAANSKSSNKAERTSDMSSKVSASANSNTFKRALGGLNLDTEGANKFEGKGETGSNSSFNGSITASVVDVLANGNLVIAGEKQMNIRGEISHLRISGIINPTDIKAGNVVSSTKLAEARIEEMGSGTVAQAEKAGWLQRFFLSFLPF